MMRISILLVILVICTFQIDAKRKCSKQKESLPIYQVQQKPRRMCRKTQNTVDTKSADQRSHKKICKHKKDQTQTGGNDNIQNNGGRFLDNGVDGGRTNSMPPIFTKQSTPNHISHPKSCKNKQGHINPDSQSDSSKNGDDASVKQHLNGDNNSIHQKSHPKWCKKDKHHTSSDGLNGDKKRISSNDLPVVNSNKNTNSGDRSRKTENSGNASKDGLHKSDKTVKHSDSNSNISSSKHSTIDVISKEKSKNVTNGESKSNREKRRREKSKKSQQPSRTSGNEKMNTGISENARKGNPKKLSRTQSDRKKDSGMSSGHSTKSDVSVNIGGRKSSPETQISPTIVSSSKSNDLRKAKSQQPSENNKGVPHKKHDPFKDDSFFQDSFENSGNNRWNEFKIDGKDHSNIVFDEDDRFTRTETKTKTEQSAAKTQEGYETIKRVSENGSEEEVYESSHSSSSSSMSSSYSSSITTFGKDDDFFSEKF